MNYQELLEAKQTFRLHALEKDYKPFFKDRKEFVRRFNPAWSGGGETKRPIRIPDVMFDYFDPEDHEEYDLKVPFTRESWHGRMMASRGVMASMNAKQLVQFDAEHRKMLEEKYPERFTVRHKVFFTWYYM
jgi:hypothetical protein